MHLVRRALPRADLMRRADEVMLRCMSPDVALRTCRDSLSMSAPGGKADIPPQGGDFRF